MPVASPPSLPALSAERRLAADPISTTTSWALPRTLPVPLRLRSLSLMVQILLRLPSLQVELCLSLKLRLLRRARFNLLLKALGPVKALHLATAAEALWLQGGDAIDSASVHLWARSRFHVFFNATPRGEACA